MKQLLRELYKNNVRMSMKKSKDNDGIEVKFKKKNVSRTYKFHSKEFFYKSEEEIEGIVLGFLQDFLEG